MHQFPFTIDLACLASRRDFLKLDKWIEDKISEHGVIFTFFTSAFQVNFRFILSNNKT